MRVEKTTRCYNFEIRTKVEDGKGILEGRPIIYNSKTDLGYFDEIIENNALKNADLTDVRFLINHNTDMIPLARSRNNNKNSTMQLMTDSDGLRIKVKLDIENNAEAKSLYSSIERGDITGMSFMFAIKSEKWENEDTDHPLRRIVEIEKVFEVSAVTFPAYEETEINARCKTELESYCKLLESRKDSTLESVKGDNLIELYKMKNRILGGF